MYDNKTIGEAKYLKKNNGDYIPFRIEFDSYDNSQLQNMIE